MSKLPSYYWSLVLITAVLIAVQVYSQGISLTTEGVSGDRDRKKRDPVVSVNRIVASDRVKILVDAHVPSPDFRGYPIKFEFFVNRHLLDTQIRSSELPGPVGVDITPDIAAPPFNYAVVATVLHPNRSFTTVVAGAANPGEVTSYANCTLTQSVEDDSPITHSAENVALTKDGGTIPVSFEGVEQATGEKATVAAVLTVTGAEATGSLVITASDGSSTVPVTGTVTPNPDGNGVKAFEVASADSQTTLACS